MNSSELRQKIEQQLALLPPDQLPLVRDFLESLQRKNANISQSSLRLVTPVKRGTKAGELLKFAGTWQGDDLEDCLQLVRETRSSTEF